MEQHRYVEHVNPGCAVYSGSFDVGASGAVGTLYGCRGVTVAETGTNGTYTLTLEKPVQGLVSYAFGIMSDTILTVQIDSDASSTTGIITIQCLTTGSTATDPTSGDRVSFWLEVDKLGLVT